MRQNLNSNYSDHGSKIQGLRTTVGYNKSNIQYNETKLSDLKRSIETDNMWEHAFTNDMDRRVKWLTKYTNNTDAAQARLNELINKKELSKRELLSDINERAWLKMFFGIKLTVQEALSGPSKPKGRTAADLLDPIPTNNEKDK